jgi:pimeloyl-ACP methyl ester carboxylesterase
MSVLTVSGWGQPHDSLAILIADARHVDYSGLNSVHDAFTRIAADQPECDIAIGWSLGAQLLVRAIAANLLRPKRLLLIAPSYQFVASLDFLEGMEPAVFDKFQKGYQRHPGRTLDRFSALVASHDQNAPRVAQALSESRSQISETAWGFWLDELKTFSCDILDFTSFPDTLLLHGSQDVVANVAQSQAFLRRLPQARLEVWEGCGHAPHLHDPERAARLLNEWSRR